MPPFVLHVNRTRRRVDVAADTPLLWALRDTVGLTGTKFGYCQAGRIMAAALLGSNPSPNDADIDRAMSGNLCRCGTYQRIRTAIRRAAGKAKATP
jgi:aerobic-type carbon monoxide dehydrogenase small subunit (CoxS/CutS family)